MLVETKYGDTGKEVQAKWLEDTLEEHPDLAYVVGTAVTAQAAIPILRSRDLSDKVKVASYYFTPTVAKEHMKTALRTDCVNRKIKSLILLKFW